MIYQIQGTKYICDRCGEDTIQWPLSKQQTIPQPDKWMIDGEKCRCPDCVAEASLSFRCPCSGHCCEKNDTYTPEHACNNGDNPCEECFVSRCRSCGSECACDL